MNQKINQYVTALFEPYGGAKSVEELKSDLLADLNERFAELVAQGKDEHTALEETLESIGDIEVILAEMSQITHTLERRVAMNFSAQSLKESDFAKTVLHKGKFDASSLENADFSGADLIGSSFKSSDLRGASFDGANLTGVTLATSDLTGASFKNANLTDADISATDLVGTDFEGANLTRTKLVYIDFGQTNFKNAVFIGTNFRKSDLSGICFAGQLLSGVIFDGASLENCNFKGAILKNVSFKPYFALTNKYYKMLATIQFSGASMDKLTYNALKGMGANLAGVTVL